jgi:hypothetical protein
MQIFLLLNFKGSEYHKFRKVVLINKHKFILSVENGIPS